MNPIHQAQVLIDKVLENRNQMIYAINPDGSVMEIQPGCILLDTQRYQMETYIKGEDNYENV